MNNEGALATNEVTTELEALSTPQLINEIQRRLGRSSTRRVGQQHVNVMRLMLSEMPPGLHEVSDIYRALLKSGRSIVMSQLYRVLKVLEEAQLLEVHWTTLEGRPRRVFAVVGRAGPADAHELDSICKHCGSPLHRG